MIERPPRAPRGGIPTTLFFLLAAWLIFSGADFNPVDWHFGEGKRLFLEKNFPDAVVEFENCLTIHPNHVPGKIWLGKSHAELRDYSVAVRYFQEALRLEPKNQEATALFEKYSGLAVGSVDSGPEDDLQDPGPAPAKKFPRIRPSLYSEELASYPQLIRRIRKYGLVMPERVITPDLQTTLRITRLDLDKGPTLAPTPLDTAFNYLAQDKILDAVREYLLMIDRDKNLLALPDRGLIEIGEEYLTKELKEYPNDLQLLFLLGKLVFIQGRWDDAKRHLSRIARLSPNSDEARDSASILEAILNREELIARIAAARKAAEEARRQAAIDAKLTLAAGKIQQSAEGGQLGTLKKKDAEKDFQAGMDLYKSGQLEKAIESFESAMKNDPGNTSYKFQLATAYTDFALAGRKAYFQPAVTLLADIIQKDPTGPFSKEAGEMIHDIKAITKN